MKRLICFLAQAIALTAAPVITKVEPPNWWLPHSINPVRVLMHGSGLQGATAQAGDSGIVLANIKVNPQGTYLFADVKILSAGRHTIGVSTPDGKTSVDFPVLPPLTRAGRFQGFSPDDVIYLIMPDRFANGDPANDDPAVSRGLHDRSKARYYHGGDFQGIIDHLPYLKDLGVTAVWINPIYDNVNHLNQRETYEGQAITDYHGYGAVDFYATDEHLGSLDKFRELVDKAHAAGLKIILDMVENHTGPYHPWVEEPPTPTWFHGSAAQHINETWNVWSLMDPHSPAAFRRSTLDGWFLNILPDLNQDDPETARYLIQNTLWWAGVSGLDAIRQDTLPYVPRTFWRNWMAAIKREYPRMRVVGEVFDADPSLVSFFQGGKKQYDGIDTGVDSVFDFPLYFTIRRVFAGHGELKDVPATLGHDALYTNPNLLVTFLGLHDVARFMSEAEVTPASMKLAFTYLLTTRGIPMIYYGDELGMPGGNDPDNRRDFPGGWAEDPHNSFTAEGRTTAERDVFNHVRKLVHLRAELPALRAPDTTELALNQHTYAYGRGKNALVVISNGNATETVEVPTTSPNWRDALGDLGSIHASNGQLHVTLAAKSAVILVSVP